MTVVFDNIIYSLQKAGGISNYWHELNRFFLNRAQQHNDVQPIFIEREDATGNLFRQMIQIPAENILREKGPLNVARYAPLARKISAGDMFHSSYYRVPIAARRAVKIVTIHDFTYEFYRRGVARNVNKWQKKVALHNADGIICISENTKQDMLKLYPALDKRKITVIYNGASNGFFRITCQAARPQLPAEKYAIFIGDRTGYKNFDFAVRFAGQALSLNLLIVGGGPLSSAEHALLNSHLKDRFQHLQGLSIEQLNVLYNYAELLIYPSAYEGFGIPVLEAMKSGCPVIALNSSSIPEVIADSRLLMDRLDIDNALSIMDYIEKNRQSVIDAGLRKAEAFSWETSCNSVLDFYKGFCHTI